VIYTRGDTRRGTRRPREALHPSIPPLARIPSRNRRRRTASTSRSRGAAVDSQRMLKSMPGVVPLPSGRCQRRAPLLHGRARRVDAPDRPESVMLFRSNRVAPRRELVSSSSITSTLRAQAASSFSIEKAYSRHHVDAEPSQAPTTRAPRQFRAMSLSTPVRCRSAPRPLPVPFSRRRESGTGLRKLTYGIGAVVWRMISSLLNPARPC